MPRAWASRRKILANLKGVCGVLKGLLHSARAKLSQIACRGALRIEHFAIPPSRHVCTLGRIFTLLNAVQSSQTATLSNEPFTSNNLGQEAASAHGSGLRIAACHVPPSQLQGYHCMQDWLTSATCAAAVGLTGRQVSKGGVPRNKIMPKGQDLLVSILLCARDITLLP